MTDFALLDPSVKIDPVPLSYCKEDYVIQGNLIVFPKHHKPNAHFLPGRAARAGCLFARFLAGEHDLVRGVDSLLIADMDLASRTHGQCSCVCTTPKLPQMTDSEYFTQVLYRTRAFFKQEHEFDTAEGFRMESDGKEALVDPDAAGEGVTTALKWYNRFRPIFDFFKVRKESVKKAYKDASTNEKGESISFGQILINFLKLIPAGLSQAVTSVFNCFADFAGYKTASLVAAVCAIYAALSVGSALKRLFLAFVPRLWELIQTGVKMTTGIPLVGPLIADWLEVEKEALDEEPEDESIREEGFVDSVKSRMAPLIGVIGGALTKIPFAEAYRIARRITPMLAMGALSLTWIIRCLPSCIRSFIYEWTGFSVKKDISPSAMALLQRSRSITDSFTRSRHACLASTYYCGQVKKLRHELCGALLTGTAPDHIDYKALSLALKEVSTIVESVEQAGGSTEACRMVPVGVYIFGKSGIGKSYATTSIPAMLSKDTSSGASYTHAACNKHYDAYTQQYCFNVDDWSNLNPDDAAVLNSFLMTAISNKPYAVPKASLHAKGMLFESKTVIMSGNERMGIIDGVRADEAFKRRFSHYEAELTHEYTTPDGRLDKHKLESVSVDVARTNPHLRFTEWIHNLGESGEKEWSKGEKYDFLTVCGRVAKQVHDSVETHKIISTSMKSGVSVLSAGLEDSGVTFTVNEEQSAVITNALRHVKDATAQVIRTKLNGYFGAITSQDLLAKEEWVGGTIPEKARQEIIFKSELGDYLDAFPQVIGKVLNVYLQIYHDTIFLANLHGDVCSRYLEAPSPETAAAMHAAGIFVCVRGFIEFNEDGITKQQAASLRKDLDDVTSEIAQLHLKLYTGPVGLKESTLALMAHVGGTLSGVTNLVIGKIKYTINEIWEWVQSLARNPFVMALASLAAIIATLAAARAAAAAFGFVEPRNITKEEGLTVYSQKNPRARARYRDRPPEKPQTLEAGVFGTILHENFPLENMWKAITRVSIGEVTMHGIFIGGTVVILPIHMFLRSFISEPEYVDDGTIVNFMDGDVSKTFVFEKKNLRSAIVGNAVSELCAYDIGLCINRRRDLRKHLITEEQLAHIGSECHFVRKGSAVACDLMYTPQNSYHGSGQCVDKQVAQGHLRYRHETKGGDCGSPILTEINGNTRICGMHYGSAKSVRLARYGFAIPLTRERLEDLTLDLGFGESAFDTRLVSTDPVPPKIVKSVPVGYLRENFSGLSSDTDLLPSIFYDCPELDGIEYEPAIMSARDNRPGAATQIELVDRDWQRIRDTKDFKQSFVDRAVEHLSDKFRMLRPRCNIRVLNWEEAVYGTEAFPYLSRINMKSTAGAMVGFGSVGPKRNLFEILPEDDLYRPLPQLVEEVKLLEESYASRKDHPVIWSMFLKSELRPKAKIEAGLTRNVMASPVSFTILCRKYFGAFMNAFHGLPIDTGFSAIGMDPYSRDWESMIANLLRFGQHGFDGDFKKFEGVLTAQLMVAIKNCIDDFYGDVCCIRDACLHAMLHSFFRIGPALYKKERMNPSGNVMTSIINIMANALLMRICFQYAAVSVGIPECKALSVFTRDVGEFYMGDDNIMSVSDDSLAFFNSYELSKILDVEGNITYTTADKLEVDAYVKKNVVDCEFLKGRTVKRMCSSGQRFFCWADEASVLKSLLYVRKSEDNLFAAYCNANAVLYRLVPSGPKRFKKFRNWMSAKLAEEGCVTPLYSYNFLKENDTNFDDLLLDMTMDKTFPQTCMEVQGGIATKITNYNIENVAESNIDFSGTSDVLDQDADAQVDAKYGLDRPNVNLHDHMVRKFVGDMATACNIERANNMDLYGNAVGETLNRKEDTATSADENSIKYLVTKPSLLFQGNLNVNMAPNTTVWSTLLAPNVNVMRSQDFGENSFQPSLLGFVTVPYAFWRGSLKYKFQFITSKVHTLRVAVLTHYGTTSEAITLGEAFGQYGSVFDVTAEQTEFEVEVPWRFDRPWARISHGSMGSEYIMGELSLRIINPLVANNTVAESVDFNVFISGGDDFEVNFLGVGINDFLPIAPGFLDGGTDDLGVSGVYFEETKVDSQPAENRTVVPKPELDTIDESEMTFTRIVERAQIMATLNWDTNATAGAIIRSFDVPLSSVTSRTTASPWNRFLYYNIPVVRFRIDLQSTLFQAGMLAVTFVPLVDKDAPYFPTLTDVSVLPHVMIKAGSNVSTTFDVPWLHQFSALRKDSDISLGRMYIIAFNSLSVAPDATSLMNIARLVVYASFPGADFKVVDADDQNEVPINPVEIQGEGGVVDEPEASGEADAPVSTTVLAPEGSAGSKGKSNQTPYGSIRDGFKRYLIDESLVPESGQSAVYPYDNVIRQHGFIRFFAAAFRFYTGTVRLKVMGFGSRLTYVPEDIVESTLPSVTTSLTRRGAAPIAISNSSIGLLEAQLPFQTNLKFLKVRSYNPINNRFLEYSAGRYCIDNIGEGAISEPLNEIYAAGGDDFRMFYLYRVPRLSLNFPEEQLFSHDGRPLTLPQFLQISALPTALSLPLKAHEVYQASGRFENSGLFTVTTLQLSDQNVLELLGVNRKNFDPITYSGTSQIFFDFGAVSLEETVYVTPSNEPGGVFHDWGTTNSSILFPISAAIASNTVNDLPGELDTEFTSINQFGALNTASSHHVVIANLPTNSIENFFNGIETNLNNAAGAIFVVENGGTATEHRRVPSSNILTTSNNTGYWNLGGDLVIFDDGDP
uniref:Genome polyprotein n=1 Tax=Barns Ness breadcrumb sponge picorna-like virus 3 TaxID=2021884 RepID=A0A221LFI9_9VIRU|nr:hypothetical protein [Barns Ness breadcrumb sponge picorna-like virus 3]